MSRRMGLAAAVALAVSLAWPLAAQEKTEPKKKIEKSQSQSITATVEAIDTARREVTLKGPKGRLVVVEVPEAVKRFSEIKVGDELTVNYSESVVIQVKKAEGTAKLGMSAETGVERTAGQKPGGVISRQITATVAVEAVDPAAPSVTVRTAEANTLSYRVQDAKNLEGVKPGDKIVVTYTEAVAVQVSAPKK